MGKPDTAWFTCWIKGQTMGQKVFISPENECVYTWLFDTVTDQDLSDILRSIRSSPAFKAQFNEFVDLSRASTFQVSTGALEETGYACSALFSAPAKRVIFAPGDVAYGVSRMYQVYAERTPSEPVYVVRTKAEGCSLLNIDEKQLPGLEAA